MSSKDLKKICDGIVKSYGAMTETLKFLHPIEQLKMQALSIWWYNIAVGRVQTSYSTESKVFYIHPKTNILNLPGDYLYSVEVSHKTRFNKRGLDFGHSCSFSEN